MSASQIPNLLDSLRAPSQPRSRRRGPQNSGPQSEESDDDIVQHTDDDASGSRLSAVEAGYLDDAFARAFATSQDAHRRMPIINRGTYVRTTAIDRLVLDFFDSHGGRTVQVVSLGAGTDTRFFRLAQRLGPAASRLRYHEVDFAATTARKIAAVERTPAARALLEPALSAPGSGRTSLSTPTYSIHALDLRSLASPSASTSDGGGDDGDGDGDGAPPLPGLAPDAPTLLLAECCLTYLPPATSAALLTRLARTLVPAPTPLHAVLYEPLHPHDAFGRTMRANLLARNIRMPGLAACPTLEAHAARLVAAGFSGGARGVSVRDWWEGWVDEGEKGRLRGLEMVDEEEEWALLAAHYGVVWALRGARGKGLWAEGFG